jgi:hypothetical protein
LILFVDAFAFDYLAKRPLLPGFWQEMLPLETLLGYSSSLVPSLWSGRLPDELGIWNEFFYQPRKPYRLIHWIDLLPGLYLRNFLRLFLFHFAGRYYPHVTPVVPSSVEANFIRNPVSYRQMPPVPLGEAGIDARLKKSRIPFHFWYPDRHFKAADMLGDLKTSLGEAQVFIYGTATIDILGHIYGPHPEKFEAEIAEIESFISGANEILSNVGPPTIVMVSDHGMTEVAEEFDLLDWLKPWELGVDFLAFLDATMARFWDIRRQPLYEIVARVLQAHKGRFLGDADLSMYGLNFPDQRFGDLIFILKPGCILKPSFMDSPDLPFFHHKYRGMHGYEPAQHSSTRAVFLYHGSKDLLFKPRTLIDVIDVLDGLFSE